MFQTTNQKMYGKKKTPALGSSPPTRRASRRAVTRSMPQSPRAAVGGLLGRKLDLFPLKTDEPLVFLLKN